jgi:hypothetical protein
LAILLQVVENKVAQPKYNGPGIGLLQALKQAAPGAAAAQLEVALQAGVKGSGWAGAHRSQIVRFPVR